MELKIFFVILRLFTFFISFVFVSRKNLSPGEAMTPLTCCASVSKKQNKASPSCKTTQVTCTQDEEEILLDVISRCIWQRDCQAKCQIGWQHSPDTTGSMLRWEGLAGCKAPNIIPALHFSSQATWNNTGHVLPLLLLGLCAVIYKRTQLIKADW